ncbi:putative histidine kinase 1 [Aspergillus bombycis]|uniref:Putative histidine kinase 1 n=1 Tax=Aspergillus bombycis TaxID=109264 RepID=A0A1F8AF22_9EURO|nr:putative histidine kinase 1 [Aspergillus bombycis]OGM50353.1 putative histidine kinase 1 [Aspergillus bombycis]
MVNLSMSRKSPLDAVVSHIHDALSQEGESILIQREVLSTILDAATQSTHTERALAQVEADYLSVRYMSNKARNSSVLQEQTLREQRVLEKGVGKWTNRRTQSLVQSREAPADIPNESVQDSTSTERPMTKWINDTANISCNLDDDMAELPRSLDLYEPFRGGSEGEETTEQQIDAEVIDASTIGSSMGRYFAELPDAALLHGFEKHIGIRTVNEIIKLKNSIRSMTSIVEKRVEHCDSARKAVEMAYHSKSELLATMSHEIRTPVHGIMGMAQLGLEAGCLPTAAHDAFNLIHSLGKSLLANINNVLDLSRIEASRMAIESIPFNLGATVLNTLKPLAVEASKKKTDLTYEVGSHVPQQAIGDPNRLCQLLFNLVGNAVKFTTNGRIELSVTTAHPRTCVNNECILEFSVADTGVGIQQDKLELIFDKFQQADDSVVKQFGGTGLGLAISRKLVSLMGGDIWVQSTVGMGSTFSFTCPLKLESPSTAMTGRTTPQRDFIIFYITSDDQERHPICETIAELDIQVRVLNQHDIQIQEHRDQQQLPDALIDRPRHPKPSQTTSLSVLIAEDNDICRLVAVKALEKCTSDITAVTNGLQALHAYQSRQFDVIVMDIQMPVMDGFEAVSKIRNYERTHNTKRASIIAVTADAITGDCLGAEMDEYVSKPLNPNQLLDVVLTCHSEGVTSHTAGSNMGGGSACEINR